MTIQPMENVGVVVDDLAAATAFFLELGPVLEGEAPVEGPWVDRVVGLDGVRVDVAMVRTPDGHGRLELMKFHTPAATTAEPNAPANTLGIRRIMSPSRTSRTSSPGCAPMAPNSWASWGGTRTAIGSATSAAPRASSLRCPRSSTEATRFSYVV
jgi:hypothetical protein